MKTFNLASILRPNIRSLRPYRSARDDFRGKASIHLDANENPFPSTYHRYPDARQQKLRSVVSQLKGTSPGQTLVTHGSDEAIDLLLRAFCRPQLDHVIIPQPTYGMYGTFAAINDVAVREVPLTPAFALDPGAVRAAIDDHSRIIFLCSPNNPSGNLLRAADIRVLLESFPGLVVIDEAYIDFAGAKSWTLQLQKYPNLVVLQTFSKAWGLAGIRAGVCFAHPSIIQVLENIKPPYNISSQAEEALCHSIQRLRRRVNRQIVLLRSERDKLKRSLERLSLVHKVFPSYGNFLLVRVANAPAVYAALLKRGIVVRLRNESLHCDNCLRITLGTPAQNRQLLQALSSL